MSDKIRYFTGLGQGQARDYTAVAVLERTTLPDPKRDGRTLHHYAVRHLERLPLGTPYPEVGTHLVRLFAGPPLAGTILAVDFTGVGRPVLDLLRRTKIPASLRAVTITGGSKATFDRGGTSRRGSRWACCRSCCSPAGSRWPRPCQRHRRWCRS
jgi:hypothetical protein